MLDGQTMLGACASFTVTVKLQVVALPDKSMASNAFVVTPTGNVAPLGNPEVWVVLAVVQLSVPTGVT